MKLVKIIKGLSKGTNYLTMIAIVILMLLTVAEVLLRTTINQPILGVTELSEMMMAVLLLGMAWCALEGKNIKVDVVMDKFPLFIQRVVDTLTLLASLVICAIIAWRGYSASLFSKQFGVTYSLLKVPQFPFYWVLAFSFIVLCLAILVLMIETIAEKGEKK